MLPPYSWKQKIDFWKFSRKVNQVLYEMIFHWEQDQNETYSRTTSFYFFLLFPIFWAIPIFFLFWGHSPFLNAEPCISFSECRNLLFTQPQGTTFSLPSPHTHFLFSIICLVSVNYFLCCMWYAIHVSNQLLGITQGSTCMCSNLFTLKLNNLSFLCYKCYKIIIIVI